MALDQTIPDPSIVLDLIEAFRRSQVLFSAVSLGVFDKLEDGPQDVTDLAEALGANPDALERLLDACVGLQLLRKDRTGYTNSDISETYLTLSSPRRMTGYINYSRDVMWQMWGHLDDAIREGTHRWQQSFGWQGDIFSHLFRTPEAKREFLLGMHGFGVISSPHVVSAFDLSGYQHLVDLGGATGHLAVAACERYSHMKATVFDLPGALPLAQEMLSQTRVADRVQTVGGDFFEGELPAGDIYALGRILHDWTEAKIIQLLTKVYAALPSGGAVLIAEKVLWDDKTGPRWAQMQSLNMLVCTEGKERTLAEYEVLLQQVGFSDVRGCRTSSPLDAVLATKP